MAPTPMSAVARAALIAGLALLFCLLAQLVSAGLGNALLIWPASGVAFAFIKATEGGDHADDRFADNWAAARAAGMPRGAYHYYYFCRPALEQAAWFMSHVPKDPAALPPVKPRFSGSATTRTSGKRLASSVRLSSTEPLSTQINSSRSAG